MKKTIKKSTKETAMPKSQITVKVDNEKIVMRGAKSHTLVKTTDLTTGKVKTERWFKATAKNLEAPHRSGISHKKGTAWDVSISTKSNDPECRIQFNTREDARRFTKAFNMMVGNI